MAMHTELWFPQVIWSKVATDLIDNQELKRWAYERKQNDVGRVISNFGGFQSSDILPKDNSQIEEIVNEFKNEINNGDISAEEFNEFLSNFSSYINIEKPSFLSNLNYFLSFQLGYMYFRYFMWNFSGRQNDNQWKFDVENGNWLSGIKYIDEIRLGSQENLPSDSVNNKSRNIYFMICILRFFFLSRFFLLRFFGSTLRF